MVSLEMLLYFAVVVLGSNSLVHTENIKNATKDYPQYITYQDYENNETRVIDLQEDPDYSVLYRSTPATSKYLLFTRSNPNTSQNLIFNSSSSIKASNFNPSHQTVVIVHGWIGSQNSQINPTVRDAFLGVMDANIIVVDWSSVALSNYVTATLGVSGVGTGLGKFLAFLNKTTGASYGNMHLVGFSLGAHVVGNAGNYLGGEVARITGLDPAGPLWGLLNSKRLIADNAVYVEAIHTNRGTLGTIYRTGDVDFYPNDGDSQPGCSLVTSCSHSRSWQLFAATVTYDHLVGRKCSSNIRMVLDLCFGDYLNMGNVDLLKKGNGQYTLKTTSSYPYLQK